MDLWIDKGSYQLSTAPQGSEDWLNLRKKHLTASNFGAAIGHSSFTDRGVLAHEILGIKIKTFWNHVTARLNHGHIYEPIVRDWYSKTYGVEVYEVGLAVPKWDERLGASLDGDMGEGMIEIKCPQTMYKPLIHKIAGSTEDKEGKEEKEERDINGYPSEYAHIWKTHYDQMQGAMKICDKKWCDYIVYSTTDAQIYLERISFNTEYWDKVMYPGINEFFTEYVEPVRVQYKV
jgi:hypothetical protein